MLPLGYSLGTLCMLQNIHTRPKSESSKVFFDCRTNQKSQGVASWLYGGWVPPPHKKKKTASGNAQKWKKCNRRLGKLLKEWKKY